MYDRVRVGAQVTFSYSFAERIDNYENIITATVGSQQIFKTIEHAIIGSKVDDEIAIELSDDEVIPELMQKYHLNNKNRKNCHISVRILDFVNIPQTEREIVKFIENQNIPCQNFSKLENATKGIFKIVRTYDTLEARRIGQEFYILSSIFINHFGLIQKLFINKSTSFHDGKYNNNNMIDFPHSLPSIQTIINPVGLNIQYLLTCWSLSQLKLTFLPDLFRLGVQTKSKIIILFDHEDEDWNCENLGYDPIGSKHNLTVADISLDVVIESEIRDITGKTVLSWIYANDGNNPHVSVSEAR